MNESPSSDCVFCSIASARIPANLVYEDDDVVAFEDMKPQAPTHILLIPRKHVRSVEHLTPEDERLAGRLVLVAAEVARNAKLQDGGYRLVTNVGDDGGQSVGHLHLHLLGGRRLGWPPG